MTQQPPPQQPPVVVVTLDAMYKELTDLRGDVRSIKDTLDPAITNLRHTSDDHETRIRSITDTLAAQRADLAEIRNEVERRITPAKLWTFVASAVAASAALFDVISHFQK